MDTIQAGEAGFVRSPCIVCDNAGGDKTLCAPFCAVLDRARSGVRVRISEVREAYGKALEAMERDSAGQVVVEDHGYLVCKGCGRPATLKDGSPARRAWCHECNRKAAKLPRGSHPAMADLSALVLDVHVVANRQHNGGEAWLGYLVDAQDAWGRAMRKKDRPGKGDPVEADLIEACGLILTALAHRRQAAGMEG